MGRFNFADSDKYGTSSSTKWFSLKNDKDVARVRFMFNGIEDVSGYAVHKVTLNDGKELTVNCLRDYDEPINKCPLCASRNPVKALYYIPLYDEDSGAVKIWQRGKSFGSELASLCSRYASNENLVSHVFEIERMGAAGDPKTRYGIYSIGNADNTELDDLPEVPNIIGDVVADKSAEELEYFLDNGSFADSDTPTPRRNSRRDDYSNEPVVRRTPVSRNRTDRF